MATASTRSARAPCLRATTRSRSPSTRAGTRTTGRAASRTARTSSSRCPRPAGRSFFSYDAASHVLTVSAEGAPRGDLRKARAHWVAADTVAWNLPGVTPGWRVALHHAPEGGLTLGPDGVSGGTTIPLTYDPAGLSAEIKAAFPHLAAYAAFHVPADRLAEVPAALKGQLAVSAADAGSTPMDATSLQIPGVLDDLYAYDGPLGVAFTHGRPTLRVWAPTARSVKLHLFPTSSAPTPTAVLDLTPVAATGVWRIDGTAAWTGQLLPVRGRGVRPRDRASRTEPRDRSVLRQPVAQQPAQPDRGPRIESTGCRRGGAACRSQRSPRRRTSCSTSCTCATSAPAILACPQALRGTFRAFTVDSNGMRHLGALAEPGLTHVHLLPAFDIATVNEDKSHWQGSGRPLRPSRRTPSSSRRAVMAIANEDAFNWGYDPWHYTVPEGSYASEPDGADRILEFRQMVQGLDRLGLRVVMDVVYNHTTASGQNDKSVLDRIVPGYYHRLNADGQVENSTCCENTASEHRMMEKLLVDSVVTWAKHYKVDGFRFDLMGHHMKRNMLKLRAALDALTPRPGRRRRQQGLPLRRRLELRRGGRRRPRRERHPAQHGRHGHRHLQRPHPRRSAGRRPLQRPAGAGLPHRPLRRSQRDQPGLAAGPAGTPAPGDGLDPGGAGRQPGGLRVPGPLRQHGAGARHRLQRAGGRLHRRPAGGRQLRRGARQRHAVRRHPVEGPRRFQHGPAGADAESGA